MTTDPDSLYHTNQALHHLREAISHVGVPLHAFNHGWDQTIETDLEGRTLVLERHLELTRDALRDMAAARDALEGLRKRLS